MLLAEELNRALGNAGKSVVHSLSQAHCEWNLHPADRMNAAKADLYRWALLGLYLYNVMADMADNVLLQAF